MGVMMTGHGGWFKVGSQPRLASVERDGSADKDAACHFRRSDRGAFGCLGAAAK